MLNIGICDSNAAQRSQLHKVLVTLLFDTMDIRIFHYESGTVLLDALRSEQFCVDLLFLEIALPDMNGLKVAGQLRASEKKLDIIFLTELERYVYDGYVYHAYDYLIKPVSAKRIGLSMRRYIAERFGNKDAFLLIKARGNTERIDLSRVHYFESRQRKVAAIMDDRVVEFYKKMGDLFSVVEKSGFLRCHQSYTVNASLIVSLHNHEIILQDGTPLPVSKRYLPDVRNHLVRTSV
ncbi:MAG: response regulator transcription factor [Oscillospiraceae bacterium]|nr:response regulator transcription factor [Oscillospiraceae bacterium]